MSKDDIIFSIVENIIRICLQYRQICLQIYFFLYFRFSENPGLTIEPVIGSPLSTSGDFYKMASAEFLEQALSTDVDENAVNAIVGSLENQLVTSVPSIPLQNNIANVIPDQVNITSNSSSIIGVQKYNTDCISNSEVESVYSSGINNLSYNVVHSSQSNFVSPNLAPTSASRPTFPASSVGNGCLNLPSCGLQQSGGKPITMQPPLVIKQSSNPGQVGLQTGMVTVPMTVSSNISTSMPNVMTINKPGQNVVVTTQNLGSAQPTILPNVQILNMRPGAPTVASQKSVATVSPRVVIGAQQVVGTRAAAPGVSFRSLYTHFRTNS